MEITSTGVEADDMRAVAVTITVVIIVVVTIAVVIIVAVTITVVIIAAVTITVVIIVAGGVVLIVVKGGGCRRHCTSPIRRATTTTTKRIATTSANAGVAHTTQRCSVGRRRKRDVGKMTGVNTSVQMIKLVIMVMLMRMMKIVHGIMSSTWGILHILRPYELPPISRQRGGRWSRSGSPPPPPCWSMSAVDCLGDHPTITTIFTTCHITTNSSTTPRGW